MFAALVHNISLFLIIVTLIVMVRESDDKPPQSLLTIIVIIFGILTVGSCTVINDGGTITTGVWSSSPLDMYNPNK